MSNLYDDKRKMHGAFAWIDEKKDSKDKPYLKGVVFTEFGIVYVNSEHYKWKGKDEPESRLMFAFQGHVYTLKFKKFYQRRGLIIQAQKFAKDITEK